MVRGKSPAALRWGVYLMSLGAFAFIGYAVIFFVRNFTDSFLELGIGPGEVAWARPRSRRSAPRSTTTSATSTSPSPASSHPRASRSPRSRGTASAEATGGPGHRSRAGARPGGRLPAHYPCGFDTIGHLGLIYLATAIFVVGAVLSGKALWTSEPADSTGWASDRQPLQQRLRDQSLTRVTDERLVQLSRPRRAELLVAVRGCGFGHAGDDGLLRALVEPLALGGWPRNFSRFTSSVERMLSAQSSISSFVLGPGGVSRR